MPTIPISDGVLGRATAIMRVLSESEVAMPISAISRLLGMAPSSVHRILDQLVTAHWVERTANHQYRIGFEFYRLGALAASRVKLVELARPLVQQLVSRCDETALFAVRIPNTGQMLFAEQVVSSQPLRYSFHLHEPRSLVWGAAARSILAWLPDTEQRDVLARAPISPTGRKVPTWATWAREAREIRQQGYSSSRGHYTDWAFGIAVPVFDVIGVVGALTFVAPEMRVPAGRERTLISALQDAASHLSRSLGAPVAASAHSRSQDHVA
jgi:IclR family transcriptional regulator, acetate operon repressor